MKRRLKTCAQMDIQISKCLSLNRPGYPRLWIGSWPWMPLETLPSDWFLRKPLLRKSCALPSHSRGVPTKVPRRRQRAGTLHLVNWPLIIVLGQLAKPWIQTDHRRGTKHTTVCSSVFVMKGFIGHPGCLASPSQGLHKLSNQSLVPNGLHNTQTVLLSSGLNSLSKAWKRILLSRPFTSVWAAR